jgi:predicted flap endonuclease-1-like 5' DNA nuclease
MNWCILIPLLVGLICAILGYLLGKLFGGSNNDDCEDRVAKLEADLAACRKARTSLEADLSASKNAALLLESDLKSAKLESANLASSFAAPAAVAALIPFDADAAKAVFGKKIKQDDLTVVEGIGPKIKELFHNHDVTTWKALSECSIEKCQSVLDSGGERYKVHKPGTWPAQAKFAYEGKWAELLKWQDELDGGK